MSKEKKHYDDKIQFFAQCLADVGLQSEAEILNKLKDTNQYAQAMKRFNTSLSNNNNMGWHKVFDEKLYELDSIHEYKIRDIFFAQASMHNLIVASTSDLAKYLNIKKIYVTKALKSLCDHGIITIVKKGSGTRATKYMVNPELRFSHKK